MLDDFFSYWQINAPAFALCPDPKMLYLSKIHRECLLRLKYAVYSNKGGSIIYSDNPGDGKTSILRYLIADLKKEFDNKVRCCFIDHPSLTPNQMIQEICTQLGVVKPSKSRKDNLNQLKERLQELFSLQTKCIIIIDECQMLKDWPDTLEELRILLNYSISDNFLLHIVLSGQKELESLIKGFPEFWQRLPVRYFLKNVSREDVKNLINHRLKIAGYKGEDEIFTSDGYDAIYEYSGGIPRVICSLADLSMLVAYSAMIKKISYVEVHNAYQDMDGSDQAFHYFKFVKSKDKKEEKKKKEPKPLFFSFLSR